MISEHVLQLVERFRRLELHAAHSGREVMQVLINFLKEWKQGDISELLEHLHENVRVLLASLPPYAPALNSINKVLILLEDAQDSGASLEEVKYRLGELQKEMPSPLTNRELIAKYLVNIIHPDAVIYTHTLSETVLGVLLELHRWQKLSSVVVTESRPNNDGWITAQRLVEQGLKVRLTIDAAMPAAIKEAHLMLSGAEIIQLNGSVVGKIGAFPAALVCQHERKPLYIVSDSSKINFIPWNKFYLHSLNGTAMGFGYSHPLLSFLGNYFDVTPAHLISAYATEKGLLSAQEIPSLVSNQRVSRWLIQELNLDTSS